MVYIDRASSEVLEEGDHKGEEMPALLLRSAFSRGRLCEVDPEPGEPSLRAFFVDHRRRGVNVEN